MGSIYYSKTTRLGKIVAPLNKKLENVKWGELSVSSLFEIENTLSFNTDKLVNGNEFDYVTRTSQNQGILQQTGFVNSENINSNGNWSLGLMQMDFFYRHKPWYAGQFVRKIIPKIQLSPSSILFFTSALNKLKHKLLSVLVRDVDVTFLNSKVSLPILENGQIDFDFIENFISELEVEHIAELEAYLLVTGIKDYTLNKEEEQALKDFEKLQFNESNVIDVFDVKNTRNILSKDIVENSGTTPYLCASAENNAVSSYISYDEKYLDKGNCVFIGGKTFVVSYQVKDFYSNDSHNLVLYLKDNKYRDRLTQLYLATCVNKSLSHKYSWGDSISKKKIQTDKVSLPVKNEQPDFTKMKIFISAVQKLVIKDVVLYADKKRKHLKK